MFECVQVLVIGQGVLVIENLLIEQKAVGTVEHGRFGFVRWASGELCAFFVLGFNVLLNIFVAFWVSACLVIGQGVLAIENLLIEQKKISMCGHRRFGFVRWACGARIVHRAVCLGVLSDNLCQFLCDQS